MRMTSVRREVDRRENFGHMNFTVETKRMYLIRMMTTIIRLLCDHEWVVAVEVVRYNYSPEYRNAHRCAH